MRNLLDTHTFIWFINGDKNISAKAKKLIETEDAENFISIVSLWEISIKISLGKLELKMPLANLKELILENNFEILPVSFDDILKLPELPFHHRDPFDRLLITQSITNKLTLISKDANFKLYNAKVIW